MKIEELLAPENLKNWGISFYGYTEDPIPSSYHAFEEWVAQGHHLPLKYLGDERRLLRRDLLSFFSEFQSALVFLFPYEKSPDARLSSFVLGFDGEDYHLALRRRLEAISGKLKEGRKGLKTALSLDIHPVLEKDLAFRAGLGFIGKNSLLIHPTLGSFFIIGSIILSQKLPLKTGAPVPDGCGDCRACLDACPTKALLEGQKTLVASKCINTFTIEEMKEVSPPQGYKGQYFGCDICQNVCPYNKNVPILQNENLKISEFFLKRPLPQVISHMESLSNREFQKIFAGTSFERTGRVGVLKNLKAALHLSKTS